MPVATAAKVEALRRDLRSGAAVADLLGVSRSRVTRWLQGSGIDPLNAERVDLLELVWSNLVRIYEPEAARAWLLGINPNLGDRRPIDLERACQTDRRGRAALVPAGLPGRRSPRQSRRLRMPLSHRHGSVRRRGATRPFSRSDTDSGDAHQAGPAAGPCDNRAPGPRSGHRPRRPLRALGSRASPLACCHQAAACDAAASSRRLSQAPL